MFSLAFVRRPEPALKGRSVTLRMPRPSDYREWSALRRESAEFLRPWEPRWTSDELDRAAWRRRLRRYRTERNEGTACPFLIFHSESMVGGITVGNIRYGVSQSAQLGYWMGARHAGKGYMQDAIAVVLDFAFGTLRLHRVEAACIPDNERSIHVLEKAGFRKEGLLRAYLRIDGAWRDHLLFAIVSDDWHARSRQG